ncbi:hypothetical protein CEXT_515681 [Caerostris extrusa]|uniref:Uncharacterized protein n=1 Tax=Caerostris extrusa TaxID=172846 RepID=A0AAV4MJ85_CAEEX|nr:hypothetical protein CEXT_515681 [Caerostris extrusa]
MAVKKDTVHSDSQDDIKFSQIKRTGAPKKLERSSSLEDIPKMYLPSIEWRRNEENRTENKSSRTGSVPKCESAENLMMKLSDNMRKTKLLVDAVCQEDEVVNSLQRKYTDDVEKLYQEQQTLLNQLYQSLDATSSVFTDSRVANDEEDIRQDEALIKRRTKEEHNLGQDIQKILKIG